MIDVVIAHAEWAPGRTEAIHRLLASLPPSALPVAVTSHTKEHANVWARRVWEWIAKDEQRTGSTATLVLNDDVTCHPEILSACEALSAAFPDAVISLHGNFPAMRQHAQRGAKLLRCYWPSGPAYLLPRGLAGALLAWLDSLPPDWFAGNNNEDGALAAFFWRRQTPTLVTVPALVRHDTSVRSTLPGYDEHPNRRSWVDWADGAPMPDWNVCRYDDAPYVPVPWMTDRQMCTLGRMLRGEKPVNVCMFCDAEDGVFVSERTGAALGLSCSATVTQALLRSRGLIP